MYNVLFLLASPLCGHYIQVPLFYPDRLTYSTYNICAYLYTWLLLLERKTDEDYLMRMAKEANESPLTTEHTIRNHLSTKSVTDETPKCYSCHTYFCTVGSLLRHFKNFNGSCPRQKIYRFDQGKSSFVLVCDIS